MSRYLPIMNRVIADRSSDWVERGEIDMYAETRKITFDVAAECLTGLRTGAEVDHLRELFFKLMQSSFDDVETMAEYVAKLMGVRAELDELLLAKIAERRRMPTNDILGMLVKAGDEQSAPFTDRELLGQLHILLVAGHETTTSMSAWLLYLLASHPDILARVLAEMDEALAATGGEVTLDAIKAMHLLSNTVDEAGRLYSPVGNVPRGVLKDFEFGGYHVPAGTRVLLSLAACHRLPEVFANPDTFDLRARHLRRRAAYLHRHQLRADRNQSDGRAYHAPLHARSDSGPAARASLLRPDRGTARRHAAAGNATHGGGRHLTIDGRKARRDG
jgi:cytochrome P450